MSSKRLEIKKRKNTNSDDSPGSQNEENKNSKNQKTGDISSSPGHSDSNQSNSSDNPRSTSSGSTSSGSYSSGSYSTRSKDSSSTHSSDFSTSSSTFLSSSSSDFSSSEKETQKKSKKVKVKEQTEIIEDGDGWEFIDVFDEMNDYYRLSFTGIFNKMDERETSWAYETFEIIRSIHRLSNVTTPEPSGRTKKIHKPYRKVSARAYKEAYKYMLLGYAVFEMRFDTSNTKLFHDATLVINKKGFELEIKNHGRFWAKKWNQGIHFLLHKSDPLKFAIHLHNDKKDNSIYSCKAENQHSKQVILMTCLIYNKYHKVKNLIGVNKAVEELDIDNLDLSFIPLSLSPGKKFDKLKSSIFQVQKRRIKPKNIINEYYKNGGVNFFVTVIVKLAFPLSPGYLKLRKNQIKIGLNQKTFYKISFKNNVKVFRNPTQSKIFMISWKKSNKNCSVYILVSSKSERSLITRSIMKFSTFFTDNNVK
ncbi:endochitinase a [Anaeramoeba flamelloides]|uniref:Endochitinase a n=1 Tax=Anaeramoeba flamelloides TaxID=1746091 RepID=A0AAV7Z4S4_9EUKA|nr:endochitinase a [Anaeramoeba flamelloides]